MTPATYHDGQYRCTRLVNGRYTLLLDCTHATPRAAIRHSTNLEPFVSPLHASDEATTPVPAPSRSRVSRSSHPSRGNGAPGS